MEIRIPASELENLLFGPGYTLAGVTFDAEAQTIVLHAERGEWNLTPRPSQPRPRWRAVMPRPGQGWPVLA
jgi:hypothetical protein